MSETVQEIISFTNVDHVVRKELGLTIEEFCTADLIYKLSTNPKNTVPGWCHASKPKMGELLIDVSRASIFRYIKKLKKLELIEENPEQTNLLRTTNKWYEAVIVRLARISQSKTPSQNETGSINSLPLPSQNETMTPSQNETQQLYIDNNNNNTIPVLRGNTKLVSRAQVSEDHQLVIFMQDSLGEELTPTKYKFNLKCAQSLLTVKTLEACTKIWDFARSIQGMQGAPRVSSLADLEDHWQDLRDFHGKKSQALEDAHNFIRRGGPAHVNQNT